MTMPHAVFCLMMQSTRLTIACRDSDVHVHTSRKQALCSSTFWQYCDMQGYSYSRQGHQSYNRELRVVVTLSYSQTR